MMLKMSRSTTLNATSEVDGQMIMQMTANITEETAGSTYVNQNIINAELYAKHKAECRKDVQEFQTKVWEIEDDFTNEEPVA